MAEWGKGSGDHERHEALQQQVQRVQGSGSISPGQLVATEKWYRERAEDTEVPARERAVWLQLADELATRLGYNTPRTEQMPLPFDTEPDDRST